MDLSSNIKGLIFKISFIFLICIILLWISVFAYGLLYYLYIPAVAHVMPVYLKFDTSCIRENSVCRHPYDNVTLIGKGRYELLRSGQMYAIELVLDMPESERNLNQGMFMVRLDVLSQEGLVLKSSRRPALLHYKSPLFKIIYTLFFIPGLLLGSVEEKQSVTVSLFEQYMEDNYYPAHFAYIEIEAQTVEVYSANLRIHAQFTGLRFVMYYWPLLSAVVGVGFNFFLLALTVIFVWIRQIMNSSQMLDSVDLSFQKEQCFKKEAQKHIKRKALHKSDKRTNTKNSQKEEAEVEDLPAHRNKNVLGPTKIQRHETEFKNVPTPKGGHSCVAHTETRLDDWVDVSSSEKYEDCTDDEFSINLQKNETTDCGIDNESSVEPTSSENVSPNVRRRVLH